MRQSLGLIATSDSIGFPGRTNNNVHFFCLLFFLTDHVETLNHFRYKVANKFSRLFNVILIPSVKPISIIFSIRARDSL